MKKKTIVLCLIILILLAGSVFQFWSSHSKYLLTDEYNDYLSFYDAVPDEETALLIAEAVLVSVYGEEVLSKKPFNITYNNFRKAWIIVGTLPEGEEGDVPKIAIRKSDGMIMKIWYGE
jgi:hypothetical protein